MSWHAVFLQLLKDNSRHLVIYDALGSDGSLFLAVECRCVIFVIYDVEFRIVGPKYFLRFAFIKLF